MTDIRINIQSDKKDVKVFLKELKDILNSEKFNTGEDMIVVKSKKVLCLSFHYAKHTMPFPYK